MRVLFQLLDAGIGGGQLVASRVAEAMAERGDTLGLVVPGPGPAAVRFRALGADIVTMDAGTLRRPLAVRRLAGVVGRWDVLYSHTSTPGAIIGAAATRLASRTHVVHQHTFPYFSESPAVHHAQRGLLRTMAARSQFIAVAEHVREGLVDAGIQSHRIAVVPNGVSVLEPAERREDNVVVVGMLARLDPGKNVHVFLDAARPQPDVRYVVGGAPSPFADYERKARAHAASLGVEVVPVDNGIAFLRGIDVVAIPSAYEGSPLVLLEAMALGCAIVASDIPGMREVIGDAGVLVPVADSTALAGAIDALISSPAQRAALGVAAVDRVRRLYSLEHALERTLAVIDAA
jgi:glycosyltransferase involved in cell wall biosynthesis